MKFLVITTLSLVLLALGISTGVQADEELRIYDFEWKDRQHIDRQVKSIDELTRSTFGTPVRGNKSDIELIQRVINRGLIKSDDHMQLQALGAVMGNVMAEELKLEWMIYHDDKGRSRALCVVETKECLFPITMLSRRMKVGIVPNARKIYDDALEAIKPSLPKNPYDITPIR